MNGDDAIEAEAFEWVKRYRHPSFADWDGLAAWLKADSRHAEIFNRLAALDDEIADGVRELRDNPIRPVRTLGGARPSRPGRAPATFRPGLALLAASVVLVLGLGAVGLGLVRRTAPAPVAAAVTIATRPGEQRVLRLSDGSRVAVAGATRLMIDDADHTARLDQGQATFWILHDPARPFTVRLGESVVTDVGTAFDLRRRATRNTVAVAQGEVRLDGVGAPMELTAGQRLRFGGGVAARRDAIAPEAVTGWRRGRFSYLDATVSDVADDIVQTTGARISVAPQVTNRRFSGVVTIQGSAGDTLHNLAPAMGLAVARKGDVWVLSPAQDPL